MNIEAAVSSENIVMVGSKAREGSLSAAVEVGPGHHAVHPGHDQNGPATVYRAATSEGLSELDVPEAL